MFEASDKAFPDACGMYKCSVYRTGSERIVAVATSPNHDIAIERAKVIADLLSVYAGSTGGSEKVKEVF